MLKPVNWFQLGSFSLWLKLQAITAQAVIASHIGIGNDFNNSKRIRAIRLRVTQAAAGHEDVRVLIDEVG